MKRFSETTRFEDPWYRKLPPEMKLAWEYLCAKCDNAGVIDLDEEAAEFHIGASVDWSDFLRRAEGRIARLFNGKLWLTKFVAFQYGELSEKSAPHRKVLALLRSHGITDENGRVAVASPVPTSRPKEEEEDKEEDKDKDEEEEKATAAPKNRSTVPADGSAADDEPAAAVGRGEPAALANFAGTTAVAARDPAEEPVAARARAPAEPPNTAEAVEKSGTEGAIAEPLVAEFVEAWNSLPRVRQCQKLTTARRKKLLRMLRQPDWNWRAAFARFPLKCFGEDDDWKPDFDWILRADSVLRILEGKYDWTKNHGGRNNYVPQNSALAREQRNAASIALAFSTGDSGGHCEIVQHETR